MTLRPSRRMLRKELHALVDRAFDADDTACFEVVKANEHLEFIEFPNRHRRFHERVKLTIFCVSDRPDRKGAR